MQDPKGETPGFVAREPSDPTPSSSSFARERLNSLARDVLGDSPTLIATAPIERVKPYPHQRTMIGLAAPSADSWNRAHRSSSEPFEIVRVPSCAATQIGLVPPRVHEAVEPPPSIPLPLLVRSPGSIAPPEPEEEAVEDSAPSSDAGNAALSAPRAVLGRYEVVARIARGGMGIVYLCRATGEGGFRRLFALKVLRRSLTRDRSATRMFLREARIAARIYDPRVVGIVDVGVYGTQPYLVMDYVDGGSFHDLLGRHPTNRPPRLVIPIILDALGGLHAAHSLIGDDGLPLHLVHRDVSPQNMLVGLDGACRLSDFGIAKAAATAAGHGSVILHGKPAYFSPEQTGHHAVDHRADLFSVGVVLWNALTGERLFEGKTLQETLANVRQRRIPPPSTVGLRPPACLDAVCMKALKRNPEERYQSAEEMMTDLRAIAMRADLLASPNEVARWVLETFGQELEARRLATLDGAYPTRESDVSDPRPASVRHAERTPKMSNSGGPGGDGARTIVLQQKPTKRSQPTLVVAAMVALLVVAVAILWPARVVRFFGGSAAAAGASNDVPPAPPRPAATTVPSVERLTAKAPSGVASDRTVAAAPEHRLSE